MKDFLFPYEKIRRIQEDMLKEADSAIKNKKNLIAHAPTGLGKTVAVLGPALKYAIDNKCTVFFLTSRHTQHLIAIETLAEIKKKYNIEFDVADIIGKKWMCGMPGVELLSSGDFSEYCRTIREDKKCEFYERTKTSGKLSADAKLAVEEIRKSGKNNVEDVIEICRKRKVCPYEISMFFASSAKVIIADYYYIFSPAIRESLFAKTDISISNSILIIDEGHNLPQRIRDLATNKISNIILKRAIKEAKTNGNKETVKEISMIQDILNDFGAGSKTHSEKLVKKDDFINSVGKIKEYEQFAADLEFIGSDIRKKQKKSYIGSIAHFLGSWMGPEEGFTRIFSMGEFRNEPVLNLTYRCLDPSVITREIIKEAHSTIIMSGTLTPTEMYKDLLGFPKETIEKTYDSPFREENRLMLVVPETTTKFTMRNDMQFSEIARIVSDIVNLIPGNSAVFFPSYHMRDQIYKYLYEMCTKTMFLEQPRMTKKEKTDFLEKFKSHSKTGAVLLGASTGSFGEGIDLPGDFLKGVVVVGLPLDQPSLEVKELIKYFDRKFNKGWDYGYIFPAFNRCLQNAGRCIRSETDKGVIIFLDQRYLWPMYKRCFPEDADIRVSSHYKEMIEEFFEPSQRRLL